MRIISGYLRGKNISQPNNQLTRPLKDLTKESIFNILKHSNLITINLKDGEFIYHAGTKNSRNKIYSNGGRVLNFVVLADSFKLSRIKAIQLIKKLNWTNGFYRKDIGFKVIK